MNGPSVARLPQDHPARSPPAKCRRMARMIAAFSSGVVYGAKREAEAIESSTACTADGCGERHNQDDREVKCGAKTASGCQALVRDL